MQKRAWTQSRLESLFGRYNRRYWGAVLPDFTVAAAPLADCVGRCEPGKETITIDIDQHDSDVAIRDTLLHEMAHAADKSKSGIAHGYGFFRELERLLRKGVRIPIGCPEMPGFRFLGLAIPRTFPLCRRSVKKLVAAEQRRLERYIRAHGLEEYTITDEQIVGYFEDAAIDGLTWKKAYWCVGMEYGLIDVGGMPVNKWAARLVKQGRYRHRTTRASILANRRRQKEWDRLRLTQASG